jgi:hypothetical protein
MDDAEILRDIARRLPAARKALASAVGDIPASGAHSGTHGVSDRTGRLALAVIDGRDQALTDSRQLDRLMIVLKVRCRNGRPITRQLLDVQTIVDRWAPTPRRRQALEQNLRAAADDLLNKHDDHGNCESCKRVPGAWGEPHRRGLCKTCARHLDRVTALYCVELDVPPKRLVEVLQAKGKVTDQDIHLVMTGHERRA